MNVKLDKQYFICSSNAKVNITVEKQTISNIACKKLLGVSFYLKLTFQSHMHSICKKAALKLNVIFRITPCADFNKKRFALNAFFSLNLNYCPLKIHQCGLENLHICLCLYKNITLKISYSHS